MNSFHYNKHKKRVVSTLFLYLIILLLGCDFKSPEEWENPSWYTDLTLPLINKEFSFAELLSDTMFYSDTLNVALPSDTVSNVIHLTHNVIMDPQQIPDSIFDIDMSLVDISIPDFGDMGDSILLPDPDFEEEAPIIKNFDTGDFDCFLKQSAESAGQDIFDEPVSGKLPKNSFPVGNDFLVIEKIFVRNATWNIRVENNLPFPVTVEKFSIKNGGVSLYEAKKLENIMPYESASDITADPDVVIIDLGEDKDLTFTVLTKVGDSDDTNCSLGTESGWNIEEGDASLTVFFGCVFGPIDSIRVSTKGINQKETIRNPVFGEGKMEIYRAKMASSTDDYPNKIFLDIANDFFLPIDIALTFHNFFNSVGINQWDSLKTLIQIDAFKSKKDTIDYSGLILSATIPDPSVDATEGPPITSIDIDLSVNIDPGVGTLFPIHVDDKSYITQTGPQDSIRIGNMSLEYIEAIAHDMTFEAPSAPIDGIPTGFTDIEFVDMKFGMGLFNEIGIPMSLKLDVVGIRGLETDSINIPKLDIGIPFGTSYSCNCEPEGCADGDTARTDILLTHDSLHTVYYCNNDTSFMINDSRDDESSLVDLVNIVPEQFIVNGAVEIRGVGKVTKGTYIWGNFILETPFSFRFKKQMTIIPADPWPLTPIDDPETSEKINSSLIEGEFFVDITNRSSLGGSLSLLISDSTIFPLFLDSLGIWDTQITLDTLKKTFEIDIDSISYIGIGLDNKSKALEVRFLKQNEDDEYIQQFFIGRMFEIIFPATDSIDYNWGYAIPAFPGLYTSSVKVDTTILSWLITDEPRNSTAMITFDGSPFQLTDSTYTPVTSQTTNAIEVQAYLKLKLDTGGLID